MNKIWSSVYGKASAIMAVIDRNGLDYETNLACRLYSRLVRVRAYCDNRVNLGHGGRR